MLLRMYLRWTSDRGFETELVEASPGEEAGLKSATLTVQGENAYGLFKAERGVHRLVRLSPFDSAHRRHTAFAQVVVAPLLPESDEIEIDESDLRIDTYRASGAGGQHVNKTDSAVRITHLPTGIVVQCQNERSQTSNKATAMRILRSRLAELQEEEREAELARERGSKVDVGFGSQIRSYVLHPYQMVKDHRTDFEAGNAQGVLDGALDGFVQAYLLRARPHGRGLVRLPAAVSRHATAAKRRSQASLRRARMLRDSREDSATLSRTRTGAATGESPRQRSRPVHGRPAHTPSLTLRLRSSRARTSATTNGDEAAAAQRPR